MIDCTFELNGKPMSIFKCGATSFPAFSGLGKHVNKLISACIPNQGPIPPGTYYIIDRQSGGLLGPLRDLFTDRDTWFALYAIDEKVDDETFCNNVKRGLFRLHPKGPFGRSEGCVVINKESDFLFLRTILKNTSKSLMPDTELESYGRLVVK
ncbi:DUF2778 domain-containing protein [Gammaproteobacteria bacterium AH-315-C21]|nr:DUF2778 domain-containing protein [Gammaproteobacteria bacterium AH-315-C21]